MVLDDRMRAPATVRIQIYDEDIFAMIRQCIGGNSQTVKGAIAAPLISAGVVKPAGQTT